jgi:hypothetical protein
VAVTPEVHSRGIAVILDKFTLPQADGREKVVIGGSGDERGARSEKSHIKGPKILKGGPYREEELERDQRVVGIGTPIEGGNYLANKFFEGGVKFFGEDEEEKMVGEEGNDEGVDEENA